MKTVIILLAVNALSFLVLAHDGHFGYALHEMSEEEAFLELVKRAGKSDIVKFESTDNLERKGWEVIRSTLQSGPSEEALNRLGHMIRIVGLHPSSTRYSVEQSRGILREVLPQIEELLDGEKRIEFAEYKESTPFGGTGEQGAPEGYDDFIMKLRYFDEIVAGAMNVVAIEGGVEDAVVFEAYSELKSEPFPVSFSSMANASVSTLNHRLKREGASQENKEPDLLYVAKETENREDGQSKSGGDATRGERSIADSKLSTVKEGPSNWMYAFFGVLAVGLFYIGFRVFFRNRIP